MPTKKDSILGESRNTKKIEEIDMSAKKDSILGINQESLLTLSQFLTLAKVENSMKRAMYKGIAQAKGIAHKKLEFSAWRNQLGL